MASLTRSCIALTLTLLVATSAWGQPGGAPETKDPPPGDMQKPLSAATLEELLAKALKDNPDLRVADLKVREAQEELNRARMAVMQKVVKAYHDIATAKANVEQAEKRMIRARELVKAAAMSREEFETYLVALQIAKAELARGEADLPFLVGKAPANLRVEGAAFSPDGKFIVVDGMVIDAHTGKRIAAHGVRVWDIPAPPKGSLADKIRAALDKPVEVNYAEVEPQDILEHLSKLAGVNIHVPIKLGAKKSMKLEAPVPLGAALQCFEDTFGLRILVRDYGLVVTLPDRVPPGAMSLREFWKSPAAKELEKK